MRKIFLFFWALWCWWTTIVSLVSSYLKTYYQMLLHFRIVMTGLRHFISKELTLQMTMVFTYHRFGLWYKSIDHVGYIEAKNIDFIICDHHRPEFLPMPLLFSTQNETIVLILWWIVVVESVLIDSGLWAKTETNHRRFDSVFSLVSAAIAADIVPMTGENRC
jgi:single-stranded-DNA-specific exonuclease